MALGARPYPAAARAQKRRFLRRIGMALRAYLHEHYGQLEDAEVVSDEESGP